MKHPEARQNAPHPNLEPREPVAYPSYPRRPANLRRPETKIVSRQPHETAAERPPTA